MQSFQKQGQSMFQLVGRAFAKNPLSRNFFSLTFFFFFLNLFKYMLFHLIGICFPTAINWNHLI